MSNYVDFFRFSDQYEDVFYEDGRYLYACAEPFNRAYYLAVREYSILSNGELIRFDCSGADVNYLESLEPAPVEIAKRIIDNETSIIYELETVA